MGNRKKYGYSQTTVYRRLRKYGIKVRSPAESHIIYPRKDFSGNLIEKAYLIGFKIDDLRARKIWNGDIIHVGCGSTKMEQIDWIKQLFSKYGYIWIGKSAKSGKMQIETTLNTSFSFLLSQNLPDWIIENKEFFFSFLAGFIDAEGHIGIYKNMAKFSLGNYDFEILFVICDKLNEYGINCNKPTQDKRKGKENNQGYKYNQNYWHFSINRKDELLKLFKFIEPYIKHKNKIKDLNKASENIIYRNNKNGKR